MLNKSNVIEVTELPIDIECGATYSINQANPNSYTHGMFKYPCKFIPEIPRWAIKSYLNKKGNILDTFSGSGTTALESILHGHNAYGLEIDDIANLVTTVKTTIFTEEEYESLDSYYDKIEKALSKKIIGIVPDINNIEHWFSQETIRDLSIIKREIDKIDNEKIKNFFYVCFVSIIKRVSFADDTSPKPYVSRKIIKTPPTVKKEFTNTYYRYKSMEKEMLEINNLGVSVVLQGDAINFSTKRKMNLSITSPPYINAFDYGRTMRLENLWMGTLTENDLRTKKKDYIGTEKVSIDDEIKNLSILSRSNLLDEYYSKIESIDSKRAVIVKKFFEDMEINLSRVNRVLKGSGRYMIVIGNSVIRGTLIESWKVIEELAIHEGYETDTYFNYEIKNPYIRIPRQGRGGIISRDYIIVLKKRG